jgi:tetratricopeptide (TPR) repeat protein
MQRRRGLRRGWDPTPGLYDYDFVTAEREFEWSIELNPRYATAHHWFGFYLAMMGRYEEGYTELQRAIRLDPHSILNQTLGFVFLFTRRYDQAIEQFEKAIELDQTFAQAYWGLSASYLGKCLHEPAIDAAQKAVELSQGGSLFVAILGEAYAAAGHRHKAQSILEQLRDFSKQRYVSPYAEGRIYADLGEKEEALRWLGIAYTERATIMICLKTDPRLDDLRPDPRFKDLMRRMNFPP